MNKTVDQVSLVVKDKAHSFQHSGILSTYRPGSIVTLLRTMGGGGGTGVQAGHGLQRSSTDLEERVSTLFVDLGRICFLRSRCQGEGKKHHGLSSQDVENGASTCSASEGHTEEGCGVWRATMHKRMPHSRTLCSLVLGVDGQKKEAAGSERHTDALCRQKEQEHSQSR